VHPRERTVVERLNAERDAVDAGGLPGGDRSDVDVVWVRFERDLRARSRREAFRDDVDEPRDAIGAEPRRCSAAEIDRIDARRWRA
jgi:hypothetical protein